MLGLRLQLVCASAILSCICFSRFCFRYPLVLILICRFQEGHIFPFFVAVIDGRCDDRSWYVALRVSL